MSVNSDRSPWVAADSSVMPRSASRWATSTRGGEVCRELARAMNALPRFSSECQSPRTRRAPVGGGRHGDGRAFTPLGAGFAAVAVCTTAISSAVTFGTRRLPAVVDVGLRLASRMRPTRAAGLRSVAGATRWSTSARAQRAAKIWGHGLRVDSMPLDIWRDRELPDVARDGLVIGINWSGPRLVGWSFTTMEVLNRLAAAD